jgi:hypothetical protein
MAVLKGHDFSRADKSLKFCHSEQASAGEESALLTFPAACSAVPTRMLFECGFSR